MRKSTIKLDSGILNDVQRQRQREEMLNREERKAGINDASIETGGNERTRCTGEEKKRAGGL